jgi:hypothetical protein
MSRKPIARINAGRSPQNDRTTPRLVTPGFIVTTRKNQSDRPEHSGDHRSQYPRIEPAAEQHEQKQAADQQKRQHRTPKWYWRYPFLKVSAHDGASRPSGFGRARSEHWLLAQPLSRLANPRRRLFRTCVASPCPTLSCCSRRMSLRFSQVRSRPRLGHRGRVAGRKRFVERLIEVRILIGLPRFGIGFLVHGNLSRSPFRNQLRIAVGGQNYPTIPIARKSHFTINRSAPSKMFSQRLHAMGEVSALVATSLE